MAASNEVEFNQWAQEWIRLLPLPTVELVVLWKWGSPDVYAGVSTPMGNRAMLISDPYNPIDAMAPQDPL